MTKRVKLKKMTTEPVLVVQQGFRLLGRPVIPGQTISEAEFLKVPERNREALISQGFVTKDGTTPARDLTPAEKVSAKALKKAREKESDAAIRLHECHEKNNALEKQIGELRQRKSALLESEDAGDHEDEIKAIRGQVNELEQEKSDCLEVLHAAIQRLGKCARAREAAERELTLASVDHLIEEHGELCDRLQRKIEKGLTPLILKYRSQILAFSRTLGSPASTQLTADWRLRRLLAPVLGENLAPKHRIESLKDVETKLWITVAKRTREKEAVQESKDQN